MSTSAQPTQRHRSLAATVLALLLLTFGSACSSPAPSHTDSRIPAHAVETLRAIDAGTWPESADAPGTKGGQSFRNQEGVLPRTDSGGASIRYREWDVNPKKRGQSRDAERIVTGSDGSAWYTDDHYETFERMR
ncbi:ribonuclease domain-containing protein [Antrihabitans sp. YC2-6]|uniref:ribonuclease domain-containing protein n=1 Tax=Antrihabitans sp. YC2-6 TaxID=2799498 RepID=UPI0027DB8C73|nr:ribonuclease domain-containing protein [Antrihabitans sp. YC2-6]